MYDTRFRKWGVSKIIKSSQKDQILKEITRTKKEIQISEKDWKKIMRYANAHSRQQEDSPSDNRCRLSTQYSPYSTSSDTFSGTNGSTLDSPEVPGAANESDEYATNMHTPLSSAGSRDATRSVSRQRSASNDSTLHTPATSFDLPWSNAREQSLSHSPTPALILSPTARNQELVLHNVSTYYNSRLDSLGSNSYPGDLLTIGSTSQSTLFWANVKNGIYLLKIGGKFPDKHQRAVKAFSEANSLALSAMFSEPLDFIREILATLSPTNTSINPPLRIQILSYLGEVAFSLFGPTHPITVLCQALRDDHNDPFVSQNALTLMYELFCTRLGNSHTATYRLMDTYITLVRRSGELQAAKLLASNALDLAQLDHGPESDQARGAAVELAHILTKLGEHGKTLSLRLGVVERPAPRSGRDEADSRFGCRYHTDGIAVHTMEDVAEYYVRFRDVGLGIKWLTRARNIALAIWGDCVPTAHITDKLGELLCGNTNGQVVDGLVA